MSDALVDLFVELVTARDWVSFAELRGFAEAHGITTKGDLAIELCPNGVIWAGMSQEFVDLVDAIREDGRLAWDGGSWLAYFADGEALGLPTAKRRPRDLVKGYAKPCWIPTFFRPRSKVLG